MELVGAPRPTRTLACNIEGRKETSKGEGHKCATKSKKPPRHQAFRSVKVDRQPHNQTENYDPPRSEHGQRRPQHHEQQEQRPQAELEGGLGGSAGWGSGGHGLLLDDAEHGMAVFRQYTPRPLPLATNRPSLHFSVLRSASMPPPATIRQRSRKNLVTRRAGPRIRHRRAIEPTAGQMALEAGKSKRRI